MGKLSHLNERGEANMVDVSAKDASERFARAEGVVLMAPETFQTLKAGDAKKGDVLATARIAGIMAAKKTHDLIPLCHPLALDKIAIDFEPLTTALGCASHLKSKPRDPLALRWKR